MPPPGSSSAVRVTFTWVANCSSVPKPSPTATTGPGLALSSAVDSTVAPGCGAGTCCGWTPAAASVASTAGTASPDTTASAAGAGAATGRPGTDSSSAVAGAGMTSRPPTWAGVP